MADWRWTDAELEAEIEAAQRAGALAAAIGPRAAAARYEPAGERLVVELTNRAVFIVPTRSLEGLAGAPPPQLAAVEVVPGGEGLHWEALDVDLSVPGLLAGRFGGPGWMRRLAKRRCLSLTPAGRASAG